MGIEVEDGRIARHGYKIVDEKGTVEGEVTSGTHSPTLKKAIANGALLQAVQAHPPYVVLTSHLPVGGAGLRMLSTAMELKFFADVVCIYEPTQARRLRTL